MGKSAPTPPTPPNPRDVAQAQTASNIGTAIANAYIGNSPTTTPLGKVDYDVIGNKVVRIDGQNYNVPVFRTTQTLSKDQQQLLDLQERAGINLGELAADQSRRVGNLLNRPISTNGLPQSVRNAPDAPQLQSSLNKDWSADRQRVEEAIMSRLNPQVDRDRAALQSRLANQGVTQGSEAYNQAIDEQNRQVNDLRMQAIMAGGQEQSRLFGIDLSAEQQRNNVAQSNFGLRNEEMQNQQTLRQQHLQEDLTMRNQPLSEISQLLHGSSPTIPQFQPFSAPTVANTPVGQYHYQTAALEQQQYMAQMQQQNAAMGGMYGLGSSLLGMFSDRRLKRDITRLFTLSNGLGVYLFQYIWGGPHLLGFMADEVEKVCPQAVGVHPSGFKTVRYDLVEV